MTALSLPFLAKKPLDLPPIVSVELIQITEKTNIPFAPKAKKTIEEIKEKEKKLVSEQAPPKKVKKKKPEAVPMPEENIKKVEKIKDDTQNPEKIEAIIHPEGLIHSLVEFCDGTILAAMALPDMKIPISYGLGFPEIVENGVNKIDIQKLQKLSFQPIDPHKFPSIDFAYFALNHEKGMPIILNAANEVAVELFMKNKISFLNIYKLISTTLNYAYKSNMHLTSVSLESILEFNEKAKEIALNFAAENIK